MINRLLATFNNPRRHMAFLVGLLALVLALTVVVAWRASEADRERVSLANAALDETASLTLDAWAGMYREFTGGLLVSTGRAMGNPDYTLEALNRGMTREMICGLCEAPDGIQSIFTIDAKTRRLESAGVPIAANLLELIDERIESGELVAVESRVHAGTHFVQDSGVVRTVFLYLSLDRAGTPVRISGVVLSPAMSTEMVEIAFASARRRPGTYAQQISSDQLFVRSAYVGDVVLVGDRPDAGMKRKTVDSPVYGLAMALAPRSSALGLINHGLSSTAERTTIYVLMVAISVLLITAMFQVRRDAVLTRLRADFVAAVTHELRTPLAQIRMFTETLLLGRVRSDVERRRSLEIIDQETRRLAHLVENVLLFAKAEGGRRTRVAPEPTQFTDEIRHAIESLAPLCRNRSAEVRTELEDGITVPVDRMALRQIMVNLVDNALKYGPTGQRITVGAALFDDVARLWVDDEGPGIPEDDRAKIFDSFYRLPRESQSRVAGSGIGLAVVRELAVLHGGSAWAEAAPGRGARIVVEFPDAYLRSEEQARNLAAAS